MTDSLDPSNWPEFRKTAHKMLDAAIDKMQSATEGRVWNPPDALTGFDADLPIQGNGIEQTQNQLEALLPYGVGNTHPRFFGWVHGAGSTSGLVADIAAAAMNANLGGRHHGAMLVEKQVVAWVRQMFDFSESSSGLVVSGTSMATIIALKVARDSHVGQGRKVGYTSAQAHSCVKRAFDMVGLGKDALRLIPVNDAFEMDLGALQAEIAKDRAAGLQPFFVAGTAGSVNVGAIDDLNGIADIAASEKMWFHIDGAFGAAGILSDVLRPRLTGLKRADSLAFDFHKWLHVNYDAGFVLIKDEAKHRAAFSERPEYLTPATRGLAAGNPWPVDYGPELSRGFRALKIWAQINEHGVERLGQAVTRNCEQAKLLEKLVLAHPKLDMVAPVAMQIVCFRHIGDDALNEEIVLQLQESGIAAPSTTVIDGRLAIRVNITNHRTRDADLEMLVEAVVGRGSPRHL